MSDSSIANDKIYQFAIIPQALKEWSDLNYSIKAQFISKLHKLKFNPVTNNRLSGLKGCYKIKLKRAGYRLVYQIVEDKVIILIWAVDKRDDSKVYKSAKDRLMSLNANSAVEIVL